MKHIWNGKQDHRGLTLLELIIGLAILSIIAVVVARNMFTGRRLYGKGKDEANLQLELQQVVDHISDEMMECEKVICAPDTQCYLLYKSNNHGILIYRNQDTGRGAFQITFDEDISGYDATDLSDLARNNDTRKAVLGKDVINISITNDSSVKSSVEITIEKDGKSKYCKKQVILRNAN